MTFAKAVSLKPSFARPIFTAFASNAFSLHTHFQIQFRSKKIFHCRKIFSLTYLYTSKNKIRKKHFRNNFNIDDIFEWNNLYLILNYLAVEVMAMDMKF